MTTARTAGRPARGAREISKAEVLNVALELLNNSEGQSVSFRLIAQQLGVTAMAVAHHVGSRREMLSQIATGVFSDMAEAAKGKTPAERLRFLLGRYCEVVLAHPGLLRCILADPELFPEQLARLTELIRSNIAALTTYEQPDMLLNVIVDYTHGFALSVTAGVNDAQAQLSSYRQGLDWIISRIPARQPA